jgi:integrase
MVRDYVNPVIGAKPIEKVNRAQIKDLLADVLATRTPKTVELLHAVISGIFGEAIERGYTKENPANLLLKRLLPPKRKRNQGVPDPFSQAELDRLLEAAWKYLNPTYALVVETIAKTGMRLGECLAMHADRFDAENKQYMVSENVRRGKFGLPKTGKRLIDVAESLVPKLEEHSRMLRRSALENGHEVGYLFPKVDAHLVQRAMKRACRFAKLRARTPHDLRHTYATLLLMAHISPAYVQKQLGHHSITMTVDTYGHWLPGEGRCDIDQALGAKTGKASSNRKPGLIRVK